MLLFNTILLIHFLCFAIYLCVLLSQWRDYDTRVRNASGMILGIILLITGIVMVALKYPHVNYYKVVPKTALFAVVTIINGRFNGKVFTKQAYYALIAITLLAACIAVVRV
ncbi:hypothetical protein [Chitinophaga ginsengisoli]|uniref:Uncharacterized protein n=1 Tax=Chitinophaga ginsengisoli TaxID=363837 RepID=A0A2P8FMV3_9BACT|nr:hypothetical protein [Chitinophaga ginsengisoli]PSL23049.1 hypothetical protein CLV42_11969 [Chitinophaga ginsengisoli]